MSAVPDPAGDGPDPAADVPAGARRRGLVLGAGGMLGLAWAIGALRALEEAEGFDPRSAEVVLGTSAGSILAALVGCGLSTSALVDNWRGTATGTEALLPYHYEDQRAFPPRPLPRLGSSQLLVRTLLGRVPVTPLGLLAAVSPAGRGSLGGLSRVIEAVAPAEWPTRPQVWISVMDYDNGAQVVLGRPGSPPARLADATTASCAIPGWYRPVVIAGRRYVDGGTISPTSAQLLAGLGLDEVIVVAPMASFAYDRATSGFARVERRMRRAWTRRLLREADAVRRSGAAVTLLAPGPEDLEAIGANLMDPRRRLTVMETSLRTSRAALAGNPPGLRAVG